MMNKRLLRNSYSAWLWLGLIFTLMIGSAALPSESVAAPLQESAVPPSPDEISVAQAKDKKDQGAILLDVREPSEWYPSHIPGSMLFPLGQLENRLKELPRDKEIVVVCRSGGRSSAGRDILKKAGFTQVTSMAGGMNAWKAAGYPTVSGQQ
jgi:rhodanese-related sulfurtransferase